jgi:hypothetical protein
VNQRSFTTTSTESTFGFDRWAVRLSGGTATYSAQTFTPGAAPVAGYESTNFARLATTVGNDYCSLRERIEDVRTFAGQTVTLSFWAKGTNPTTLGGLYPTITQIFGTGGSSAVINESATKIVLTANWTRYSITFAIASISGKTIGTGSYLDVALGQGSNTSTDAWTLDLWGVQLEAGSTASPFQTATGTIQGELAACQRYYYRQTSASNYTYFGGGFAASTTQAKWMAKLPTTMRTSPSFSITNATNLNIGAVASQAVTSITLDQANPDSVGLFANCTSGLVAGQSILIIGNNSSAPFIEYSSEL